jgi:hypothetical protein
MEFMSQYNFKIMYIKGEENTVADALPCTDFEQEDKPDKPKVGPFGEGEKIGNVWSCAYMLADAVMLPPSPLVVASTFSIDLDIELLLGIKNGYPEDL